MSNYSRILNQFSQKCNIGENDRLNEYGINKSLDRLLNNNTGRSEFNRDVAMEIFEQTPKNNDGTVTLRDYINTILRANQILYQQISTTERQIQTCGNPTEKEELKANLEQFTDDLMLITKTFNLPGPARESGDHRLSNSFGQRSRRETSRVQGRAGEDSQLNPAQTSGIFETEPSVHEQSTSLQIALVILMLCFVFEVIVMFVKDPFMSCLAYIMVFAIYLLNYFDRWFIRACLITLLITIVLDIVWLIVMAGPFFHNTGGFRSTLQPGFLGFAFVMTIILMVGKLVIMIILYRYKSNTEHTHKFVRLHNLRFDLDGRPENNPIYNLFFRNDQNRDYPNNY